MALAHRMTRSRAVLLVVGGLTFIAAAAHRFRAPQWPIIQSDVGYWLPALNKLAGDGFAPLSAVNFVYPSFVYLVAGLFRDFRVVTIIQHLLGLAAGVLFFAAWGCLAQFLPPTRSRRVHWWIGGIASAVYLLSNTPVVLESQLRVDAICMFAEMLCVYLALQSICDSLFDRRSGRALLLAVGTAITGITLAAAKPSFLAAAVLLIGVTTFVNVRVRRRPAVALVLVAAISLTDLTLVAAERYFAGADPVTRIFLPQTLFSIHAKIIHAQMVDDIASAAPVMPSQEWLRRAAPQLGSAIQETHDRFPRKYRRLGFEPDYLVNGWNGHPAVLNEWRAELGDSEFRSVLNYWYRRALTKRPLAFVRKITGQMGVFYASDCPAFRTRKSMPLDRGKSMEVVGEPAIQQSITQVPASSRLADASRELAQSAPVRLHEPFLVNVANEVCRRTFLAVCVISIAVALAMIARRTSDAIAKRGAFVTLLLQALVFANVLSISVIHSMEVSRYSSVLYLAALLAQCWSISWLWSVLPRPVRTADGVAAPR